MHTFDVIVVGGGITGSAIAYGLARRRLAVAMLDEGDDAFRATRGSFGLIWIQGRGAVVKRYADWSRESTNIWPEFAAQLRDTTGIDACYERRGSLVLCQGEEELEARRKLIVEIRRPVVPAGYDCTIIDRRAVQELLPAVRLGDAVVGASYCRHDGHVDSLRLLRALQTGYKCLGGHYFPGHAVGTIHLVGKLLVAETVAGRYAAPKIVIAAGLGIAQLAPMIGVQVPIRPRRGQVLVTERTRPILPLPMSGLRQTAEGTVMLGFSQEDVGFDTRTTIDVTCRIATRAVKAIPALAALRLVRTWAALRIQTPDEMPVYQESQVFPGAYVATSPSGVTLAAVHAGPLARWIADGTKPPRFERFGAGRFDVQKTS